MNTCRLRKWLPFVSAVCLFFSGCGGADRPEMGYVSGIVTMDGKPMGNIIVIMKPEIGRSAMVRADEAGRYDIEYTEGERGTKVGPTTVTFEWPLDYAAPVAIPAKYTGVDSAIKIDVKPGDNKFDIKLESDGDSSQAPAKRVD